MKLICVPYILLCSYWIIRCNRYRHLLLQIDNGEFIYNKLNGRRIGKKERDFWDAPRIFFHFFHLGILNTSRFWKTSAVAAASSEARKKIHLFPDWSRSMLSPGATGDRHSARTNNAAPWFHVSPGSCIASFRFALLCGVYRARDIVSTSYDRIATINPFHTHTHSQIFSMLLFKYLKLNL